MSASLSSTSSNCVEGVYNSCTVHTPLEGTPAMAAGWADEVWSVEDWLWLKLPKT